MRKLLAIAVACAAVSVSRGGVSSVSTAKDDDGCTVISYTLSDASAVVTFDVLTNGVSVGASGVARARGDVWKLMPPGGPYAIRWRADRDLPEKTFAAGDFEVRVTAWPTNDPPDYMVIDLVTNNAVRVPRIAYYPTADHLPAGGLRNRNYARTKLVMRKIPAANRRWTMGDATAATPTGHDVILTENYYIGIYETTGAQGNLMSGGAASYSATGTQPHRGGYNGFRGTDWPANGSAGAGGEIAKYRAHTGLALDMPTEAQWEFAARAGEYAFTAYNGTNVVLTGNFAPMLDEIAWYGYNSTNAAGKCVVQDVGLLKPNAYGLYDVLGNVYEWCLDYWRGLPGPAVTEIDPKGGSSGNRVQRGGCYNQPASNCMLTHRRNLNPTWSNDGVRGVDGSDAATVYGIRLVCPAIAVR